MPTVPHALPMSELPAVIAAHFDAVNAFDTDGIVAMFAPDALVNDNHREFWGSDAIRAFVEAEFVGDRVTVEPVEVVEHHGTILVRGRVDGDYDKTGLPDPLILSHYFTVRDGRIDTLIIIHNR
jgi:hypothetical protein